MEYRPFDAQTAPGPYREQREQEVPRKGPDKNAPAKTFHASCPEHYASDNDEQVIDYGYQSRDKELLSHEKNRAETRAAEEKYLSGQNDPQEECES
jgi:hypothetical protein